MKKLHLLATITIIFTIIAATPTFADTPKVLTVDAEITQTISYSGTTEEGVLAVSCGLYDAEDNELQFNSVAVLDEAFTGEFDADENAILIRCANYDGGAIVERALIIETDETPTTEEDEDTDIPNTGAPTSSSNDTAKEITISTTIGIVIAILTIFAIVRIRVKKTK